MHAQKLECLRLRETLKEERLSVRRFIWVVYEADYRCEYLSDDEIARMVLARKRIVSIDRPLVELDNAEWGGT